VKNAFKNGNFTLQIAEKRSAVYIPEFSVQRQEKREKLDQY
jgi:hypothetical protein